MKKLIAFLGIAAMLLGLRLFDNGLLNINQRGTFTVFSRGGAETVYNDGQAPILYRSSGYSRLDVYGDYADALSALKDLGAKMIRKEQVGELTVIYAYSPYINRYEKLSFGKVNVMAAVGGGKVVYGSPLIKGSY